MVLIFFLYSSLLLVVFCITCSRWIVGVLTSTRYFKEHGWPSSTILEKAPEEDEDRAKLIDTLQAYIFFPFCFLSTYIDIVLAI